MRALLPLSALLLLLLPQKQHRALRCSYAGAAHLPSAFAPSARDGSQASRHTPTSDGHSHGALQPARTSGCAVSSNKSATERCEAVSERVCATRASKIRRQAKPKAEARGARAIRPAGAGGEAGGISGGRVGAQVRHLRA